MKNLDPPLYIRWIGVQYNSLRLFPGYTYKIVRVAPGFDLGSTAYTVVNHFGEEVTVSKKDFAPLVPLGGAVSAITIPPAEQFVFLGAC